MNPALTMISIVVIIVIVIAVIVMLVTKLGKKTGWSKQTFPRKCSDMESGCNQYGGLFINNYCGECKGDEAEVNDFINSVCHEQSGEEDCRNRAMKIYNKKCPNTCRWGFLGIDKISYNPDIDGTTGEYKCEGPDCA